MRSGQRPGNETIYCLHGRMNGVLVNSWGRRERRKKWRGGEIGREGDWRGREVGEGEVSLVLGTTNFCFSMSSH